MSTSPIKYQPTDGLSYDPEEPVYWEAGKLRAEAVDVSDRWGEGGCDPGSPMLGEERALLVRSYASLLAAVHR